MNGYQRHKKYKREADETLDKFMAVVVIILAAVIIGSIIWPPSTYQGIH